MGRHIYRSIREPKSNWRSWQAKWKGEDKGLIACWEVGRDLREQQPELATLAEFGELPVLVWKGGVERKIQANEKFGTLNYLAYWQGLRGDDLEIDLDEEPTLTCSRTGMRVTYTADPKKFGGV